MFSVFKSLRNMSFTGTSLLETYFSNTKKIIINTEIKNITTVLLKYPVEFRSILIN